MDLYYLVPTIPPRALFYAGLSAEFGRKRQSKAKQKQLDRDGFAPRLFLNDFVERF